jgi:hypothetical protein
MITTLAKIVAAVADLTSADTMFIGFGKKLIISSSGLLEDFQNNDVIVDSIKAALNLPGTQQQEQSNDNNDNNDSNDNKQQQTKTTNNNKQQQTTTNNNKQQQTTTPL